MRSFRLTSVALPLVALGLTAATCNTSAEGSGASSRPDAAAAKPAGAAGGAGTGAGSEASQVLSGIPGMDFSTLSAPAQKELAGVMTDEFCYCGCPHTLGACLKTHPTCKHARRMAALAATEAAAGAPSVEIIVGISKYYQSFRERRATLKVDDRLCTGARDAKVTLVEFSDFECPYCGSARPVLEEFVKANAQRVRFCFAPFPLQAHPNGLPAAQAALFARDQGKFWAMHDLLFENQLALGGDAIPKLGAQLGLNPVELKKAIESGRYNAELNASKEQGKSAGVVSTPTVFVNGRKLDLLISSEALAHTVDDELEWASHGNGWGAD